MNPQKYFEKRQIDNDIIVDVFRSILVVSGPAKDLDDMINRIEYIRAKFICNLKMKIEEKRCPLKRDNKFVEYCIGQWRNRCLHAVISLDYPFRNVDDLVVWTIGTKLA